MNESFWGTFIISAGVIIIGLIFFMQKVTNSEEEISILIKETTEAAMMDAFDYDAYYSEDENGEKVVRINREVFVESFVRRFSQNASLANTYVVEFYDVNEYPPKVSIRVKTKHGSVIANQEVKFDISDKIDAILELSDITAVNEVTE